MKKSLAILSFLLTLVVVLLTVQPTLVLASENHVSDCCGSACSDEEEGATKNTTEKGTNCKGQNCNPFQSCGCCLGFTVKSGFFGVEPPVIQKTTLISKIENSISQYTPDFWQPPKIS